jgi:hypothetical protein
MVLTCSSVEGVPTIAWGLLVLFLLPSRPDTVAEKGSWLFRNEDERELIKRRTLKGIVLDTASV